MMRQVVKWFSEEMENKLNENDDKGGWRDCKTSYLLKRLKEETAELEEALLDKAEALKILSEAVDIANFAMMIADNAEVEEADRIDRL